MLNTAIRDPSERVTPDRKHRIPDSPTLPRFTDAERKMLRGRPSSYRADFAQDVIEDLSDGYSLGGYAGRIGVARSTLNIWMERYPEFKEACARAAAVRQRYWEKILIHVAETGGTGSQGQIAIFGVINAGREDWKQKQEIEHTGQVTLATLVETSMRAIEGQLVDVTPRLEQPVSTPLEDDLFS